jgi:CHASE1-domain containing sensor protein
MNETEKNLPEKRSYPSWYEKIIPIMLGLVGLAIIVLLLIIFAVVSGILPGS